MKRVFYEIWQGDCEDCRGGHGDWYAGEDGMIALVTLIAVVFFLILIALVANAGKIVSQKMEVQNGTDSVTYSASLVMARGMNGVTGANHAIGELTALIVLHHALGGDELDAGEKQSPDSNDESIQETLGTSYDIADTLKDDPFKPDKNTYELVKEIPDTGATIYRSCVRLQQVLGWTYQALAFGEALWQLRKVPIVGPFFAVAGGTISTASLVFEKKIWLERQILKGLFKFARFSVDLKKSIHNEFIPLIYEYSDQLVFKTRHAVRTVVNDQKGANLLAEAVVDPNPARPGFQLPLQAEPDDTSDTALRVSQLTRAAYPWVNEWRHPLLEAMKDWLLLARSAHYYRHYTDLFTYQKVRELKEDGNQLYVLRDYRPLRKGTEKWASASGSQLADDMFCLTGFGLRDAPRRFAPNIYRAENRDGIMAYAQAMFYNANPQRPASGLGESQAEVGWDTLNWQTRIPEIASTDEISTYEKGSWDRWSPRSVVHNGFPKPRIRLNWQVKLVPVSKLERLSEIPPARVGEILNRLEVSKSQFRTH